MLWRVQLEQFLACYLNQRLRIPCCSCCQDWRAVQERGLGSHLLWNTSLLSRVWASQLFQTPWLEYCLLTGPPSKPHKHKDSTKQYSGIPSPVVPGQRCVQMIFLIRVHLQAVGMWGVGRIAGCRTTVGGELPMGDLT